LAVVGLGANSERAAPTFRRELRFGTIGAMSSAVRHATIDCRDPYQLATFWTAVLGAKIHDDDQPDDPEVLLTGFEPPLLFIQVPESKSVKNRIHFDVQPQDRTRDEEVERLLELGATLVGDHRREGGLGWVTLADPEGNEFCVERSRAERAG
jgi:catechol 2,3-dioxygenase-like lactoylglutathione lyase family enzyme